MRMSHAFKASSWRASNAAETRQQATGTALTGQDEIYPPAIRLSSVGGRNAQLEVAGTLSSY